jgi:hypothetical protein
MNGVLELAATAVARAARPLAQPEVPKNIALSTPGPRCYYLVTVQTVTVIPVLGSPTSPHSLPVALAGPFCQCPAARVPASLLDSGRVQRKSSNATAATRSHESAAGRHRHAKRVPIAMRSGGAAGAAAVRHIAIKKRGHTGTATGSGTRVMWGGGAAAAARHAHCGYCSPRAQRVQYTATTINTGSLPCSATTATTSRARVARHREDAANVITQADD